MKKPNDMTFFEHLGELRKRLFYSLIGIMVFFLVAWNFVKQMYVFVEGPVLKFLPPDKKLVFTSLTEPFYVYLKLAFIAGLFLASPFVFYQFWLFIKPALYKKEKKMVFPFVFFSTVFFIMGGAFAYYVVLPFACRFFIKIGENFEAFLKIGEYFSLALQIILGIAIIFELPILVYLLSKLGIISARFLIKSFKYAIIIIFIVAAVITPTPDVITQSIFAFPMILLYGLGIIIAKVVGPKEDD